MADKIARLGIVRDNDLMYFIKGGAVWAVPRKKPGEPKGKQRKIADIGAELDYSKYLYFVDGDGDVARKARNSGGGGRKKSAKTPKLPKPVKTTRSAISGHFVTKAAAARHPKTTFSETRPTKTVAQLEQEIQECLASKTAGARKKRR